MGKSRNNEDSEQAPILPPDDQSAGSIQQEVNRNDERYQLYKRRWYILFLFVLFSLTSSIVTNSWGPITLSAQYAFGWNNGDIAVLQSWSFTMPVVTGFLVYWLLSSKGLRVAVLLCSGLLVAGTSLRCIFSAPPHVTWSMNLGQSLAAASSDISIAGANVIAAFWFPPEQRLLVTAIGVNSFFFGNIFPNLFAIFLVTEGNDGSDGNLPFRNISKVSKLLLFTQNETTITNGTVRNMSMCASGLFEGNINNTNSSAKAVIGIISNHSDAGLIETIRTEIMNLMYVEFIVAIIIFILIVVYFPSKPPSPPDASAEVERLDFKDGLNALVSMKLFWVVLIIYALVQGVGTATSTVVNIITQVTDFSQSNVDILSTTSVVLCMVTFPFAMIITEKLFTHSTRILALLYGISMVCELWFTLMLFNVIPRYFLLNFATPTVIAVVSLNLALPILLEIACEVTYPVQEGVTTGILDWATNPIGVLILLLFKIPHIGVVWLQFVFLAVLFTSALVMLLMKFTFLRRAAQELV